MPDVGALSGKRVLVVEDEYFIMDDLCRELVKAGATVVGPAPSVGQAIELIASGRGIDGAIVDMNLHGEIAHQVADTLRWRSIPFIFTTGYERTMLSQAYPEVPHVEKPATFATISEALSLAIQPSLRETA